MSPTDVVSKTFPEDQRAVEKRVQAIFDAARAKDFDRLASYHLDHPKFSKFDDFEPLDRQDAAAARQSEEGPSVRSATSGIAWTDSRSTYSAPSRSARSCSTTYSRRMERRLGRARSTLVFVNDGGHWKIAHEHFSPFKSNP